MSDSKLVKTILNVATLTGLAADICLIGKRVAKENFTSDLTSSSSVMNYAKFTVIIPRGPKYPPHQRLK